MNKRNFFKNSLMALAGTVIPAAASNKPIIDDNLYLTIGNNGIKMEVFSSQYDGRYWFAFMLHVAVEYNQDPLVFKLNNDNFQQVSTLTLEQVKEILGFSPSEVLKVKYKDTTYSIRRYKHSTRLFLTQEKIWPVVNEKK